MALTLTFINSASSFANAASYNHGSFTAAEDGLLVVVALSGSSAARTISTVSIGGTNGTIHVQSGSALEVCGIATRPVAAGAHNVTVTYSSTMQHSAVAVYLLTGYDSETPADTDGLNGTGTSVGITLDFPTDGIAVYGNTHANNEATGWSAAAEDFDAAPESNRRLAAAHKSASGAGDTETAGWTTSAAYSGVGAVWAPAGGGGASIIPRVMHLARQRRG